MTTRLRGTASALLAFTLVFMTSACSGDDPASADVPSATETSAGQTNGSSPAADTEATPADARAELQQHITDFLALTREDGLELRAAGLTLDEDLPLDPPSATADWVEEHLPRTVQHIDQRVKDSDPMAYAMMAMNWPSVVEDSEAKALSIDVEQVTMESDVLGVLPTAAVILTENGLPMTDGAQEGGKYVFEKIAGEWKLTEIGAM